MEEFDWQEPGLTELLVRARKGDHTAANEFINRLQPFAEHRLGKMRCHRDDIADIVQDAFRTAIDRNTPFQPHADAGTRGWFTRILRNTWLSRKRGADRERSVLSKLGLQPSSDASGDINEIKDLASVLVRAMRSAWTGRLLRTMCAFWRSALTNKDAALALKVSAPAVTKSVHEARVRLLEVLQTTNPLILEAHPFLARMLSSLKDR